MSLLYKRPIAQRGRKTKQERKKNIRPVRPQPAKKVEAEEIPFLEDLIEEDDPTLESVLGAKTASKMLSQGIESIDYFRGLTDEEILSIKGIGQKSLDRIKEVL